MKLTEPERRFLAGLSLARREVICFLERRVVNTRGLFGIRGKSPVPSMSFAAPGFDARQVTEDEYAWLLAWQQMGLIRIYELEPGSTAAARPAKLGLTHQVVFSQSMWRIAWSLRLGQAHVLSSHYHSQ